MLDNNKHKQLTVTSPLLPPLEDLINNKYNFVRESIRNYAREHFDIEK